jgi:hypothetical protein
MHTDMHAFNGILKEVLNNVIYDLKALPTSVFPVFINSMSEKHIIQRVKRVIQNFNTIYEKKVYGSHGKVHLLPNKKYDLVFMNAAEI